MSYKKYIKRGGKVYGPYVYHSRKVNGRVTSEYLGKFEEKKKKNFFPILIFLLIFLLASALILIPTYNKNQTNFLNSFLKSFSTTTFAVSQGNAIEAANETSPAIEDVTIIELTNQTPQLINQTISNETVSVENNTNIATELSISSETLQENQTKIINETAQIAANETLTANETISNKVPIVNETLNQPETNITQVILTEENATIQITQYPATLGQPVKWKKQISPEALGNITITVPKEAENIIINKVENISKQQISPLSITGGVISSQGGFFAKLFAFLGLTGKAIKEIPADKQVEVEIDDVEAEYEVEYETPAPYSIEQETERGKQVEIVGLETVHYQDVLSFTNLNEIPKEQIKLYRTTDGLKENTEITNYIDNNNNGLIDKIEWITPQLSNETFEIIIEISKAEHLNSNKEFISDIYPQVSVLDDVWSETINNNEYIRVTFEQNLTKENDITLYPRVVSGTPIIEVYEKNASQVIAEFNPINSNEENKIYLAFLPDGYSQDTFDLKVLNGELQLDYIVDPLPNPTSITLIPLNGTQNATSGRVTENAFTLFTMVRQINLINFSAINRSGGDAMRTEGNTSVDAYVQWNITLPQHEEIYSIFLNSTSSIVHVNRGDSLSIALYNFSVGATGSWRFVNSTANQTVLANRSLTFNITPNLGNNYISNYTVNGIKVVRFIIRTNGTATQNLSVDFMQAIVNYEPLINPDGNIVNPENNTNQTSNIARFEFNATDNFLLKNVTLYLWNSTGGLINTNSTDITGTYNSTNITLTFNISDHYEYNFIIYDDAGNDNWTAFGNYTLTFDMDPPDIKIVFPTNNTNTSNTNLNVNYTVNDNLLIVESCWYSNDTYVKNTTLANCGNITNVIWTEGSHNVTVWANDTVGNENYSTIFFMIDTIHPSINITFPINNTHTNKITLNVNYTVSDANLAYCWYSNDSYVKNTTLADCKTNITDIIWTEGIHNVTVWVNDTVGNVNNSKISFEIDTKRPDINITFPINNTNASNINLDVNYTASDPNLAYCWYSNDTYVKNTTLANCGTNITDIIWIEGPHNVTVWANGTVGNENFSKIFFTIDTIPPTFTNLNNQTIIDGTSLNYDIDATDTGTGIAYFAINWTSTFSIVPATGVLTNSSALSIGSYFVNVSVNDSAGNMASGIINITILVGDTEYPVFSNFVSKPTNASVYSFGAAYMFNVTVTFTNGSVVLTFDDANYTAKNTTIAIYNVTLSNLAAGTYPYNWSAYGNGTNHLFNMSNTYFYTINKSTLSGTLTYDTALTRNYDGTPTTFGISESNLGDGDVTYTINKNGVNKGVSDVEAGAGNYIYILNTTGGTNYTSNVSMDTKTLTINQIASDVNLSLNNLRNNITINQGASIDLNCSMLTGDATAYLALYREGSLINNLTSPVGTTSTFSTLGVENITCIYQSTQNYTRSYETWFVNVTDLTNPSINITFPTRNNTNWSVNTVDVNYTASDANLAYCWYSNDTYVKNTTITCGTNITDIIWTEGQHNAIVYANDTLGNFNSSRISFMVDTTDPNINITSPINNTNWSINTIDINYTISDSGIGISNCWWSNDSRQNATLASCNNLTDIIWYEGTHNISIWVNDTLGNVNKTYVTFTVDTIHPSINIAFPINNTNSSNTSIDINYTVGDSGIGISNCWWSNDSRQNATLASCNNLTEIIWAEGIHNISVWVNDTVGNANVSYVTFTVDTINPSINITSPINNTNSSGNTLDVLYVRSDANLAYCWYSNGTYAVNNTLANCGNITSVIWGEGQQNVIIYANDSAGNFNSSRISFTIDTINPSINITYPINNTNTSNTQINVNYTASDTTGLFNCWYTNSSGKSNVTLANCGANITGITWPEGINNVSIYVNDSAGNINSSRITFTIDTINPQINITYPAINNTNWTINTLDINYTRSDANLQGCFYSNDTFVKNTTLASCGNITTVVWIEGTHNVRIYANDSAGNFNTSSISFTIDTINPGINITSPINNTNTTNTQINVNYTASDINGLSSCWYTNSSGLSNVTLANCGTNITGITWPEGINNITIYINDTFGNVNLSRVTFTVDTIKPSIQITYPSNNTNTTNTNIDVNYTVYNDYSGCYYSNDSYAINTTITCGVNITTISWADAIHDLTVWVNDSAGNVNYSRITFMTDTLPPTFINLANKTLGNGRSLNYDIEAVDDGVGLGTFAINWTSTFSIVPATGVLTNSSALNLGMYWINISVNDTLRHMTSQIFYVNVTEIVDLDYPVFSNFISIPNNASIYTSGQIYKFNSTITSHNGTAGLALGGVNYTTTNVSNNFQAIITDLAGGTYPYYWWAYGNGTLENFNRTITYYYTINQSSDVTLTKFLNGVNNNIIIPYPQQLNATASSTQGTVKIYRNDADVTSQNRLNVSLPAGYYEYKFNVTGNSNYTGITGEFLYANITQATGLAYLYINGTRRNFTSENLLATRNIWLNATLISGTGNVKLWVNGTLYNNGTSPQNNITNLTVGFYNVTSKYAGNINYTPNSEVFWINITLNPPSLEIVSPRNETYVANTSLLLNYSATSTISINPIWYSLDSGTNTTITTPVYFNISEGSHILFLYANNSNGFTTKNITFFVNLTKFIIYYNEYKNSEKGNSTNFNQYSYEQIQNLSNVILENVNYGKILFNQNVNITNDANFSDTQLNLDNNTNISYNLIELNSDNLPDFNKLATLWLYNLTFSNPRILKNNAPCSSPTCVKESYSDGVLKFNITGFTTYSAEETPAEAGAPSAGEGGGEIGTKPECSKDSDCNATDETCFNRKCIKLFDIKITDFDSPATLGEFFDFTYFLKGMAEINGDVQIDFWIEQAEKIVTSGSDVIYLGSFQERTETTKLFLPDTVKTGVYDFVIKVSFDQYEVRSHRTIQITVREGTVTITPIKSDLLVWIILIFALIIILAVAIIIILRKKKFQTITQPVTKRRKESAVSKVVPVLTPPKGKIIVLKPKKSLRERIILWLEKYKLWRYEVRSRIADQITLKQKEKERMQNMNAQQIVNEIKREYQKEMAQKTALNMHKAKNVLKDLGIKTYKAEKQKLKTYDEPKKEKLETYEDETKEEKK